MTSALSCRNRLDLEGIPSRQFTLLNLGDGQLSGITPCNSYDVCDNSINGEGEVI